MRPGASISEQQELAARVRQGDAVAFERLFRAYYTPLVHFAVHIVGTLPEAEEVVQRVFVNIWRNRAAWAPHVSVAAYLYGAVRNEAVKYSQRRPPAVPLEEAAEMVCDRPHPDQQLVGNDLTELIERLIQELPEQRRLIFTLSRDHGLTYAEIAQSLGISIKTVETQMGRALRQLRERLQAWLNVAP
ncbi:RNA polymerase, sigma-24 subunit, ECF subfamily [Rhodothermus marinus SG0.5JP17-172]|jgi:RNA polymerase sigma-70 factor (ECF subfamily)|uniref:RNA polymerase sigma-70 factor n=1 Tax=Rhodothermus marinus TaxID=29549 RepID=UPI000223D98E|nr:RNA polymerase sigma-70 factor [Rhodothermus marinus]AEN72950.1 RNA polymerase, sigma-24 subunit, ECF subfamily [Rhodothermus marinus SG0.5JP17-172]MBO2492910.1 RNA polymerase sigma-70 factor [Rhodothermus marinus]